MNTRELLKFLETGVAVELVVYGKSDNTTISVLEKPLVKIVARRSYYDCSTINYLYPNDSRLNSMALDHLIDEGFDVVKITKPTEENDNWCDFALLVRIRKEYL